MKLKKMNTNKPKTINSDGRLILNPVAGNIIPVEMGMVTTAKNNTHFIPFRSNQIEVPKNSINKVTPLAGNSKRQGITIIPIRSNSNQLFLLNMLNY